MTEVEELCPEGMHHYMTLQAVEEYANNDEDTVVLARLNDDAVALYVDHVRCFSIPKEETPNKTQAHFNPLCDYDALLARVLEAYSEGSKRPSRPGVNTTALFAEQIRIPLDSGFFPWPTRKRARFRSMAGELLTFLQGGTKVSDFEANDCGFWSEWGEREYLIKRGLGHHEDGDLGPIYSAQYRRFGDTIVPGHGVDQIEQLIEGIINDPYGRRHIVSAWNPLENEKMALPPCHVLYQCWLNDDLTKLKMHMYMRSGDLFIGVPYNIGSYALLSHLICNEIAARTDGKMALEPCELVVTIGDAHIYHNHIKQVAEYLSRPVKKFPYLNHGYKGISNWNAVSEVFLDCYDPHPRIKAPVAV